MAKREYNGDPLDMTQQHISDRDLDEEAEDVEYATNSEMPGEESVDFWPSSATPREDLNEKQVSVIEAAADPTREFDSMAEMSREVVPEMSTSYANDVVNRHWGACELVGRSDDDSKEVKKARVEKTGQTAAVKDGSTIDKMRRQLVSGETTRDVAEAFDVTKDAVQHAAKEKYEVYAKMDTQTPRVEYSGVDGWQFVGDAVKDEKEPAEENAKNETSNEEQPNEPAPEPPHHDSTPDRSPEPVPVADGGAGGSERNCVKAALAAVVLWEVARRLISRIK